MNTVSGGPLTSELTVCLKNSLTNFVQRERSLANGSSKEIVSYSSRYRGIEIQTIGILLSWITAIKPGKIILFETIRVFEEQQEIQVYNFLYEDLFN